MKRATGLLTGLVMVFGVSAGVAAEEKTIATQKTNDIVIMLKNETGQWKQGPNTFVVEFTSAKDRQPLDAGTVTLSTSMSMPGMAPMLAGTSLEHDKVPGRYLGKIQFPDSGSRQVTVRWDGPAGKGSTRFSVPVR